MECRVCGIEKLSSEFPPEATSKDCDHPLLTCLRCVVKHAQESGNCAHPGCHATVDPSSDTIELFQFILSEKFKEYKTTYTPAGSTLPSPHSSYVYVTLLNGESKEVYFRRSSTVLDLKMSIEKEFRVPQNKQKLIYNDKELVVYDDHGQSIKLSDLNIKHSSTIYLVVLLYAIPERFNDVVFDLYWGYPVSGVDYLDASCLVYNGQTCIEVIDYCCTIGAKTRNAIRHSGDIMNNRTRTGHHVINVQLKNLPGNITHLFFTLSAWTCPNISKYPNPSLKFYEASNPSKNLCKTTFTHARNSQAVVMCSVSRGKSGQWEIFESGQLSAGNASHYSPLKYTIKNLIARGF